MEYFSDREKGPAARIELQISQEVWSGILAHVESLVINGAFGKFFPKICPDGEGIIGTDENAFCQALKAEIPNIELPLSTTICRNQGVCRKNEFYVPDTFTILDFIQFCYMFVAEPIPESYHHFFKHNHLSYDVEMGRKEFRETINRILARNRVAYELREDGSIEHLAPPIIGEEFKTTRFNTGDQKLDEILSDARKKYFSTDPSSHREAVERLWDAWERLKTIEDPNNKKRSVAKLLESVAGQGEFRKLMEEEAAKLTKIGNSFHIRHSEIGKIDIERVEHFDYLFHRLLSMILLLIRKRRG